ncbi:MAG: hypothetical protein AAFZ52_14140 [Bacteroidota bacterium]
MGKRKKIDTISVINAGIKPGTILPGTPHPQDDSVQKPKSNQKGFTIPKLGDYLNLIFGGSSSSSTLAFKTDMAGLNVRGMILKIPATRDKISAIDVKWLYAKINSNELSVAAESTENIFTETLSINAELIEQNEINYVTNDILSSSQTHETITEAEAQSIFESSRRPFEVLLVDMFKHYEERVGAVFFNRYDLSLMYHYGKRYPQKEWVFSGAQVNFAEMVNPRLQFERYTSLPEDNASDGLPDGSICFTLKAEMAGKYHKNSAIFAHIPDPANQNLPAALLGLPCPIYWDPEGALLNFLEVVDIPDEEDRKSLIDAVFDGAILEEMNTSLFSIEVSQDDVNEPGGAT